MKKLITLSCLMAILSTSLMFAQEKKELKISSLSLSSGEGPLSNGLFFEANFSHGNNILNVSLGERDMYFIYFKRIGSRFYIGPSFEFYYNLPLLGVMAIATPVKLGDFSISTTTWSGISAGEFGDKADLTNWQYLFFWQSIDASFKNLSLTVAIMNFNDIWGPLVDLKYRLPINDHWKLFSSAGYSWYEDNKALLKLGVIYNF